MNILVRAVPATAAVAAALAALPSAPVAAAHPAASCRPSVMRLPDLGYGSGAIGVSGDVVAGFVGTSDGGQLPAIWRGGALSQVLDQFGVGVAQDVNSSGEVVGQADHMTTGFAVVDGIVHPLPPDDASFFYARRVNSRGQIAGAAFDGNYAARWDSYSSAPTELPPAAGDQYSFSKGINDGGWVAGDSDDADFVPRPAIWTPDGQPVRLPSAFGDGQPGDLFAIDDSLESVGESFATDADGNFVADQATLWNRFGRPRLVPLLPGTNSSVGIDLSDDGVVVGVSSQLDFSTGESTIDHALLWPGNGPARTLPTPGIPYATSESDAHAIDAAGTVVGSYGPAGGQTTAAVWTCAERQAYVVPHGGPRAAAATVRHRHISARRFFARLRRQRVSSAR